jgi:hypothetical protein
MKILKLSVLIFAAALSSCGGGGSIGEGGSIGGGSSSGVGSSSGGGAGGVISNGTDAGTQTTSPEASQALFAVIPVHLPNPNDYYTCNDVFQNMMNSIDVNGDGKLDLVFHYWCNQWNKPATFNDPTPNSLVVYVSQPDGSYKIANEEVFGRRIVELSGASRKSRVADFNNDGYMDIFYAMNHEDGRAISDDRTNQYARAAFLMSTRKGKYRVDLVEPANWFHGIDVAKNNAGGYDAVANGFGYGNDESIAFRNVNNQWQTVSGYPRTSLTMSFNNDVQVEATQLVTGGLQSAASLQLMKKTNNIWVQSSSIVFDSKIIPFTTWQGSNIEATAISLNGNDIVSAGYDETCMARLTPKGNMTVIARMNGYIITGGYNQNMGRIKEGDLNSSAYHSLHTYEIVGDKFIRKMDLISGEDTSLTFNQYECRDINGDGYVDIVGYPDTVGYPDPKKGRPVIYINNGQGKLVAFSSGDFPVAPDCYGYTRTRMADLNQDGIEDLIVFRQEPSGSSCGTAPIMIYYGNKKIKLPF